MLLAAPAFAQNKNAIRNNTTSNTNIGPRIPHQIALIDLGAVFNNYDKFNEQAASLQKELEESDLTILERVKKIKAQQEKLTDGSIEQGSPDFVRIESAMLRDQTDLAAYRKQTQRHFLRREADLYKKLYLEVEDVVKVYSKHYHYTLVLRFNREDLLDTETSDEILSGVDRRIMYYRLQDDITGPIVTYLNETWAENKKRQAIQPVSAN